METMTSKSRIILAKEALEQMMYDEVSRQFVHRTEVVEHLDAIAQDLKEKDARINECKDFIQQLHKDEGCRETKIAELKKVIELMAKTIQRYAIGLKTFFKGKPIPFSVDTQNNIQEYFTQKADEIIAAERKVRISVEAAEKLKAEIDSLYFLTANQGARIDKIIDSCTEPEKEMPDVIYIPDDCEDGDHGRWRSKKDIFISPGSCEWKAERTSPEDYHYYRARDCMPAGESKIESVPDSGLKAGDFVCYKAPALHEICKIIDTDKGKCQVQTSKMAYWESTEVIRHATDKDWEKEIDEVVWRAETDKSGWILVDAGDMRVASVDTTYDQIGLHNKIMKSICKDKGIPIKPVKE